MGRASGSVQSVPLAPTRRTAMRSKHSCSTSHRRSRRCCAVRAWGWSNAALAAGATSLGRRRRWLAHGDGSNAGEGEAHPHRAPGPAAPAGAARAPTSTSELRSYTDGSHAPPVRTCRFILFEQVGGAVWLTPRVLHPPSLSLARDARAMPHHSEKSGCRWSTDPGWAIRSRQAVRRRSSSQHAAESLYALRIWFVKEISCGTDDMPAPC